MFSTDSQCQPFVNRFERLVVRRVGDRIKQGKVEVASEWGTAAEWSGAQVVWTSPSCAYSVTFMIIQRQRIPKEFALALEGLPGASGLLHQGNLLTE